MKRAQFAVAFASMTVTARISDECQARADRFCAQDCYPKLQPHCDGQMYARRSGDSDLGLLCYSYSRSTLSDGNASYDSSRCYCTLDVQLANIISDCNSGITSARVFAKGDAGVCYRIPAVVQTTSGVLVAFAEARHGGCGDDQVRNIAVSRSTDHGHTWSAVRSAASPARSSGNVGNPMPFALNDGRVALAYVYRDHGGAAAGDGNAIVFSDDDGVTWSEPHDISDDLGPAKGSMPGPGAGIQLQGSGRLLMVSHSGPYVADHVTYSDDVGATWRTIGQKFPKMDEATMADLGDGNVLLNFRHLDEKTKGRAVARSSDGGLAWTNISYDSALKGPVCQGSLASIGSSVFFSNPASTSGRNHLTIKRSDDGGRTWPASWLVREQSSAGYSSLVQGTIGDQEHGGILFESDSGCIDFKTFPVSMSKEVFA